MQTFTSNPRLFLVPSLKGEKKMGGKNRMLGRNNSLSQMLTFNYKTVAVADLSFYLSWHL